MEILEEGLLVDFKDSSKYAVESFIENSEFYGYLIEGNKYLFPSQRSEYDILEKALECEFNSWEIRSFTFEGL